MAEEKELKQEIEKLQTIIYGLTHPNISIQGLGHTGRVSFFTREPGFLGSGVQVVYPEYQTSPLDIGTRRLPLHVLSTEHGAGIGAYGLLTNPISDGLNEIRLDVAELQLSISELPHMRDIPLHRMIQVSVFTQRSTTDDILAVWEAMEAIFQALNCITYAKATPESGSWLERWIGKTKDVVTSDVVIERVAKLERAAELRGIDNPQADADLKAAKAMGVLMKALKDTDNGLMVAHSVGVLKRGGVAFGFTLSQEQLAEVRKNPALLKNPEMFEKLLAYTGDNNDSITEDDSQPSKPTVGPKPPRKKN